MSGSTWGAVVGAGVGFMVGGPAGARIGWMAGSFIGGIVDPDKIYGPKLTDAQSQTVQDGVARSYGYGTFPTTGNLIWRDPKINEVKKKDNGKGGPVSVTYTYKRSYAIGVTRGPIAGYLIIKRNGKIVYDARTDAELTALGYSAAQIGETRAAQSKWMQVAKLYLGTDTQLPDPTIEAVKGIGNVPAYRGSAYIVCTDDDVTDSRGAVHQYEFVVSECGTSTAGDGGGSEGFPTFLLVTGSPKSGGDGAVFAGAVAANPPVFAGIPLSSGATIPGMSADYHNGVWLAVGGLGGSLRSTDDRQTWQSGTLPFSPQSAYLLAGGDDGWLTMDASRLFGDGYAKAPLYDPDAFSLFSFDYRLSPIEVGTINWLSMVRYTGGYYYGDETGKLVRSATLHSGEWEVVGGSRPDDIVWFLDVIVFNDELYATVQQHIDSARFQLRKWNGSDWNTILIDNAGGVDTVIPFQMAEAGGNLIVHCDGAEVVYTSADGFATTHTTGISGNGGSLPGFFALGRQIASTGAYAYIISDSECVATADGITFSTPATLPISNAVSIAAGAHVVAPGALPIPDAPGYYVDPVTGETDGPVGAEVDRCTPMLGDIVAAECASRRVLSIDVSELTDYVDGFRVASETSAQRNIQSLQVGYVFDGSEYDGVLHFPKRGAAASFALTEEDFVSRAGDPVEWEITKENELLRKVTVGYVDPDTTYTPTTQDWERRAGTIKAQGEGTLELPITGTKDWAKQVAEKHVNIAWAESQECKFSVSVKHASLVPAQVGTIPNRSGGVDLVRITRIEDDGNVRHITAKRTQRRAYQSRATGISVNPPRFPGTDVRGPTDSILLNVSVLRDADDKPGIYWAPRGVMGAWGGAILQLQRAGEWIEVDSTDIACNTGTLLADLPAHGSSIDETNTLQIRLSDGIDSITFAQFLDEGNPLAIQYPDGTAEIVQAQFATEVSTGVYDCTRLIRNRLDTVNGSHTTGAKVVFLNNDIRFIPLRRDDLGQTLSFRAVSAGTDPTEAPVQTITLTTIESWREWQPYNVTTSVDGSCQWTVDFVERPRLGTDANPVQSQWWDGYRIDFTVGSGTKSRITHTRPFFYSDAMQTEDWGAASCTPYTITVTSLSR